MKAIPAEKENVEHMPINFNEIKTTNNLLANDNDDNINNFKITKTLKRTKTRKILSLETQERIKRIILNEFGIQEKTDIKTFEYLDLMLKTKCTSYYFGEEPIEQKAYICTVCDAKKKNYMCNHCHTVCHQKCRNTLKEIPKSLAKTEFLNMERFTCYCGHVLKHTFDVRDKKDSTSCTMMELDNILGIKPYRCYQHNAIVCCICAVVCHKECIVKQEPNINIMNDDNNILACECKSDYHSNFNELALSFPLEQYKKVSNIDVWPVQILNILFYKGKTFNKMSNFFNKSLSLDIDFNSVNNKAIINKFKSLLELFSDTFNRKFKTYYYDPNMINTFEFEKLFNVINHLEVNNGQNAIIKFRLLFILLFIHLRKDFRVIKSLTTNDFMCNSVLQRLLYKKILKSKNILTDEIDEKYKIRGDFPIKTFALKELCNLMTKGMHFISVEENQDEFEIGLKLLCFILKRLMFTKDDLILLIDSLAHFHSQFYEYIMKEKNNIYSLIDIFNAIIEIIYLIAVNYNDIVIEEYLNNRFRPIGRFIHAKNEYSNKLLSIVLKNCDLMTRHYKILIKPSLDKKSKEEQKREKRIRKHFQAMQEKISSETTGVTIKMPENGGLFTDKIIALNNETLALFSLADNSYQKQLDNITDEEFKDYFSFCNIIEDENYQDIMKCEKLNNYSNNILYNLKMGLEDGYYSLFTSSYIKEEKELTEKLRKQIIIACDNIKKNIDSRSIEPYYSKLISNIQENEYIDEIEDLRRKVLKDISDNIVFTNSPFLLIDEGREILVNNLIMTQTDETIFKGFFFLTNIHFPNIINHELVKIFLDFISLYFLTKRGVMYILTGKNIQVIQRLINRFRFDDKNKNVNLTKKRTEDFNVRSIKVVIHFFCILSKFVRKLNIKTLKKHKALFKFKKSILSHLKNFVYHIKTDELMLEYKIQLKEGLEIFNNLYQDFNFNQYEKIKFEIIEIFKNNPFKFLTPQLFQKWFDAKSFHTIPNFMEMRKYDLDFYFQFFEIITKNSFYVYENDEEGKENIKILINFIDLENLNRLLIQSPDLITYSQKTILLKFIRTFHLLDYLDPVNYIKKAHLLTTKQYKLMLKYNLLNNNDQPQNNNYYNNNLNYNNPSIINPNFVPNNNQNLNFNTANNNINTNAINKQKYINKFQYIQKLIILINFYIKELEAFPFSIKKENNNNIKNYIKELIFAMHEISLTIYYNRNVFSKILPYYYKLVVQFIKKKDIFIRILEDIKKNKAQIISMHYQQFLNDLNNNYDYKILINKDFNIFDQKELFKFAIKNIFNIYKITEINEDYRLQKYLEIYDVYNEANFPPFSLIEVYDYEYFYDGQNNKKEDNNNYHSYIRTIKNLMKINLNGDDEYLKAKLNTMRELYLEQFRHISDTAFLNVLSGDATDKKIDFGEKYVNLFQSFINSTQSNSFTNYRTLLCIMTKMLFYDGEHIQNLFNEMAYDKHFFKNLNRELNYHIVQCIDLSQKYELCSRCAEITDIAKLTIQFLQLLGEGFNTQFHENILKGIVKEQEKTRTKYELHKNNVKGTEESVENEEESSSDDDENDLDEKVFLGRNQNISNLKNSYIKKEIQLVDPKCTIYETAILNLKRIYHLMELDNLLEGESGFDKLCVLSTNIIDFIIEYIDTSEDLSFIIDYNFKKLFFGTERYDNVVSGYSYMNKRGIIPIFTMRINYIYDDEDEEAYNRYRLRKIMLAYMKIKYFQLLKAYLQIGIRTDFVKLLLAEHLGPLQLYGEILYYMKELINNLVHENYDKYKYLLNVDGVGSYKNKLTNLYMYEEDFRTSVEISVVFQICIIIATLEDIYKITILKDHFEKEQPQEKKEHFFFEDNDNNDDNNDNDNKEKNKDNNSNLSEEKSTVEIDNTNELTLNIYKSRNKYIDKVIEDKEDKNNSISNEIKESNIHFILPDNNLQNINKYYSQNTLLSDNYSNPYNNIKNNYQKNKIKKINDENLSKMIKKKTKKLEDDNMNINSKFSKAIYRFLSSLLSKVEIRTNDDKNTENNQKKIYFNSLTNQITRKLIKIKNNDIILSNINYDDIEGNNLDNNIDNEPNIEDNIESDNDKEEEEDTGKKYVFFIKPYLAFHLSEQTKRYFLYNVDRTSATSKYKELVAYTDYFMFEMMYNMKYINNSPLLKRLSNIRFYFLKVINYLLILAENCLLMYHYYRDYSLGFDEYEAVDNHIRYKRFTDIIIIIGVKLMLICFAFFIWFHCKYIITYQRNIMIEKDKNFVFRQIGEQNQNIVNPTMVKYFRENGNLSETMSLINKNINFFTKLKIGIIDSVILNIDINIFVFSFILDILFLITGHPLFLSIETLFLYGIFPSLLNIFKSFTEKFSSLCACLLFTYLILYVYNYIAIFYMRDVFDLGEVMVYDSETYLSEPFCHSSIQCFLVLISYGTRAGGGIGDVLPIISFKYDVKMFMVRFIYDMTFFIIIIMIMGNVTFGLIVDTFGALRDETYQYENDRNNKCFICQLSKDGCLLKNIDYDVHIKNDHNLWSYVNFMTYLHLYNANDFNRIEGTVWERLLEKDYGWLPINTDDVGGEDDDED